MGTLTDRGRVVARSVLTPPARLLLRLHVSPDAVTVVGTIGLSAAALVLVPQGRLLAALLVALVFVLSDTLDGTMARLSGRSSPWGAFLDSTLDRVSDAAVFGSFALYYADRPGDGDLLLVGVSLAALAGSLLVSYARARAESLGLRADVGIAERAERLVLIGVAVLLAVVWTPTALDVGIWVIAALVWVTLVQRMLAVRRQVVAGAR